MPRYRYAIGQAPVRFPSLKTTDERTKKSNAADDIASMTPKPAMQKTLSTEEIRKDGKRIAKGEKKVKASRAKAKSMYDAAEETTPHLKANRISEDMQQPRRSSLLQANASRSQSPTPSLRSQRLPDEKTPLVGTSRTMTQTSPRPASTSISASSRPSSLFWTESEAEPVMVPTAQLANTKTTYGSTLESSKQPSNDDPYGYRAMAGPSLLPFYHEQHVKQQMESEAKNRSCVYKVRSVISWKALSIMLAGCVIIGMGALYLLL